MSSYLNPFSLSASQMSMKCKCVHLTFLVQFLFHHVHREQFAENYIVDNRWEKLWPGSSFSHMGMVVLEHVEWKVFLRGIWIWNLRLFHQHDLYEISTVIVFVVSVHEMMCNKFVKIVTCCIPLTHKKNPFQMVVSLLKHENDYT